MIRLYCATGNPGKLREFRLAAQDYPEIEIELVPDFARIPPCIEDAATFEENAIRKARHYGAYAAGPLFADDSGLAVDALGGAPGVYSARFAGTNATDEDNNRVLLEKLRGVADRRARFVCAIALLDGDAVQMFHGTVEGVIVDEPRGTEGFGYDPLFYYEPFGCTLAEATAARKLSVSHRGKALRLMFEEEGKRQSAKGKRQK